ncbi:MAG: hypothetical protein L0G72_09310, partial [Brevibacterium aurantiacum]|nr:hypothetical protein [Brevibacterium aurantiacum]
MAYGPSRSQSARFFFGNSRAISSVISAPRSLTVSLRPDNTDPIVSRVRSTTSARDISSFSS